MQAYNRTRITNGKQLNKIITDWIDNINPEYKDGDMICITGPKLPAWLHSWTPEDNRPKLWMPESHRSPQQQADYITIIRKTVSYHNLIVFTYSPFIISDFNKENVLVFGKNSIVTKPEFNTFGSSVNKITTCLLNQTHTFGNYAVSELEKYRQRAKESTPEQMKSLIDEMYKVFGDSVERTILINSCINKEEKIETTF
jgi:hypothetical protein